MHAQITSLFVLVVVGFFPVLMLSFVENTVTGFVLNLLTVMSFTGLHEVSRELESPFQNVPNDIPLNNFQAQFNEALMTMFLGYHPDSYWEITATSTGNTSRSGFQDRNDPGRNIDEPTGRKDRESETPLATSVGAS